ncbi:3-deoxy-D-manno-octulosonic acid transferase [Neptunicoccus cionae]|uniref:3-deoxy-D-manno-octulosonic acid transferase n=1 Tax=Neptunicoccus cionae TaxID=2035344 RepID=UPI000C75C1D4|nr:glycosyltransferase N-terminal domain-containing protein [Amylibacter cionae]PLS22891.1 3-deoxy-D-manno-octulosonic acid transferase [Amylibacter cionae]
MSSKSLGETLIRSAARITEPLMQHELARRVARGHEDANRAHERQGKSDLIRPEGVLVWCHTHDMQGALNLIGVIGQIHAQLPEITFLVTTQIRIKDYVFAMRMPARTLHQYAPLDKLAAVERFLDHWQPDLCVWTDDLLMPVLNTASARRGIPSVLADLGNVGGSGPQFRWMSRVSKSALRSFETILTADEATAQAVRGFGVEASVMGRLCEETLALPHDETRRAKLSRQLDGRPVWLAAKVAQTEISQVLDAHSQAMRMTHRLLLIIVPVSPEDVPSVKTACDAAGIVWRCSDDLDDLPPRTDVIIARGLDGLGLWYQLAAVCFLGGSLVERGGHTPLEAAGLGSAIIHGPHVDNYADIYLRLQQAGAAIEVNSVPSLAEAVSELIVPDRAAEMAHAGWHVCSEGADATDELVEVLWDMIPMGASL